MLPALVMLSPQTPSCVRANSYQYALQRKIFISTHMPTVSVTNADRVD